MIIPNPPLPVVTMSLSSEHCHSFNAAEPFLTVWPDASLPAYFAHDDEAITPISHHENDVVGHWSEEDAEDEEASTTVRTLKPVTPTEAESTAATLAAVPALSSQDFATPSGPAVGQKTRRPLTPHYLTIIIILVGVILLFSALSAFGIKPEELLGRLWPS